MNPVLQTSVTVVVLWNILAAIRNGRGHAWRVARDIRLNDILATLLVFPVVIAVGAGLSALPVLGWGWWQALGGEGSVVFASTGGEGWYVFAMLALIAGAVPELARREEELFRRGSERRDRRGHITQSLLFGSIHALMGIPLGYALALSIPGGFFTYRYLSAYHRAAGHAAAQIAVDRATRAHIAWNWTMLTIALLATLS